MSNKKRTACLLSTSMVSYAVNIGPSGRSSALTNINLLLPTFACSPVILRWRKTWHKRLLPEFCITCLRPIRSTISEATSSAAKHLFLDSLRKSKDSSLDELVESQPDHPALRVPTNIPEILEQQEFLKNALSPRTPELIVTLEMLSQGYTWDEIAAV